MLTCLGLCGQPLTTATLHSYAGIHWNAPIPIHLFFYLLPDPENYPIVAKIMRQ